MLHLMCATGEASLSLAVLGADVVAVDISERQVALAVEKAKAATIDARFVAADVGALPPDIADGEFDLVYTGGGVLVWVPEHPAMGLRDQTSPASRWAPGALGLSPRRRVLGGVRR